MLSIHRYFIDDKYSIRHRKMPPVLKAPVIKGERTTDEGNTSIGDGNLRNDRSPFLNDDLNL